MPYLVEVDGLLAWFDHQLTQELEENLVTMIPQNNDEELEVQRSAMLNRLEDIDYQETFIATTMASFVGTGWVLFYLVGFGAEPTTMA